MSDQQTGGADAGTMEPADGFTRALLDIAAGRPHDIASLPEEDQELLAAVTDWLPALADAIADLHVEGRDSDIDVHSRGLVEVRPDDPIALMLGLVEDPAVRLDGQQLAAARRAAGLDIAQLAERLNRRGWDATIKTVSAWERGRVSPPPATINAVAEELDVSSEALLATGTLDAPTIDTLFDDAAIAAFLDEWAREASIPAEKLAEQSKRLLATAGRRNATSASPEALLAVLKHFKNLPGFGVSG
ncbi:helix-turn-helix domain-containing protein [Cellulomonas soli]|uniref:HTH cro/C1-type domain-containing protein n=1 Tax=Cellulomonas soli TaxID=931535 RepID=A0A512PIX7_9CELL|nr:helix-turn-helix domain-containing protein [Cellulomonas soli]NYI58250.1 transcriptional regulator with XRE-family HTH domain [Cellulomonas soli]GEP71102.1 hypothetical protein CSO01_38170 [Cellulomonas soli]